MFVPFTLNLARDIFSDWHVKGGSLYVNHQKALIQEASASVNPDGSIDGDRLRKNWFPTVGAHVFISHSHADQNAAIGMAGWLFEKFGVVAFVDSCLWGNVSKLLRKIDNDHCWMPERRVFDYGRRNISTSHVHALLSTSLSAMIDACEVFVFLRTRNSVMEDANTDITRTASPWIMSEIRHAEIIRRRLPNSHRLATIRESMEKRGGLAGFPQIQYSLKFDGFGNFKASPS